MLTHRIVIDTNILVAALQSRQGASHRLLQLIDGGLFETVVSVALVLEYEAAAKRTTKGNKLTNAEIDSIIDFLCSVAVHQRIHYLWRPFLKDPKDDMVLELAVAAQCSHILTFNAKDFAGSNRFGIRIQRPAEFLNTIGALP